MSRVSSTIIPYVFALFVLALAIVSAFSIIHGPWEVRPKITAMQLWLFAWLFIVHWKHVKFFSLSFGFIMEAVWVAPVVALILAPAFFAAGRGPI